MMIHQFPGEGRGHNDITALPLDEGGVGEAWAAYLADTLDDLEETANVVELRDTPEAGWTVPGALSLRETS